MDASPYRLMWFQASKPELSQIGTKYYPKKKFNNSSPLKMMVGRQAASSLSYWVSVTFQGQAVKLREGMLRFYPP